MPKAVRVVIVKPSKYLPDGAVERFRTGFMPNSTLGHIRSLTPPAVDGAPVEIHLVDEYVHQDLEYLKWFERPPGGVTLVALVGTQSHQFHRALDLAAYARRQGAMAVIGGPHPMTCDTAEFQASGVSFALAEAELVWPAIVRDAAREELRPVYGQEQRWDPELNTPAAAPPSAQDLRRYVVPILGLYPARGCPYSCSFCSVIKIAGRRIRSQSLETTLASLRAARQAGVRMIMFTSDNFNKYPEAEDLLRAMIEENLKFQLFIQCDTQIIRQERLVALFKQAGGWQIFVGVESFNRRTLIEVQKHQNHPRLYHNISELCAKYGVQSHFSNIIGFPQEDAGDIRRHLELLKEMRPSWASFYILCPIPGTQQYDEFLEAGRITERNLDRFDATHLTWNHPKFSAAALDRMLFDCYKTFYSANHMAWSLGQLRRQGATPGEYLQAIKIGLFCRISAHRSLHPMSGGVGRIRLDGAADYAALRRSAYGIDLAPLPRSLRTPLEERAAVRAGA